MNPEILFIAFGGIVILMVLFWFYKRLRLVLTKAIYGSYSEKYIDLYKRQTLKSPYSYCLKDDVINYIHKSIIVDGKLSFFTTRSEIKFGDTPFFINSSKLLKEKGEPDCANVFRVNGEEIKILGFKSTVQGSTLRSMYFLIHDKFFMGQYTYKASAQPGMNQAFKALIKKYIPDTQPVDKAFYIENKERRIFYENNGFNVYIRYLTNEDAHIKTTLEEYCRNFDSSHPDEAIPAEDEWVDKI